MFDQQFTGVYRCVFPADVAAFVYGVLDVL